MQLTIVGIERSGAIEHDEREVGDTQGVARARHALSFHEVRRLSHAGRVDER